MLTSMLLQCSIKNVAKATGCLLFLCLLCTILVQLSRPPGPPSHPRDCGSLVEAARRYGPLPQHNAERLRRLQSACRLARGGRVDRMTSHRGSRVAYCVVPKTSCTTWLGALRLLHGDTPPTPRGYSQPGDMPRHLVHATDLKKMHFSSVEANEDLPEEFRDYFRFMFVRDPYSRLWSAYVDKFLLLDFWPTKARAVERFLDSPSGLETLGRRRVPTRCHNNVTFAEFLAFVADGGRGDPGGLDEHWRPLEHLCDPCLFCPHLLGHLETFVLDSRPVTDRLNLTLSMRGGGGTSRSRHHHHGDVDDRNDSDDRHDHLHEQRQQQEQSHVLQQMKLLIRDNFRWLGSRGEEYSDFYSTCADFWNISRRLWTAFQLYGYLPATSPFPRRELELDPTEENFQAIALGVHGALSVHARHVDLGRQRVVAMETAYRNVPRQVLEALPPLFLFEFAAFGYEMRPPEIFAGRG